MQMAKRIVLRLAVWLTEQLLDCLSGFVLASVVFDTVHPGLMFFVLTFMVMSGFIFSTMVAAIAFSETAPFERARTNAALFIAHFIAFPLVPAIVLGPSSPSAAQLGVILVGGASAVFVSTMALRTGIERLGRLKSLAGNT